MLLVGACIHPELARMNDYLGRYRVTISVVSFEVFGPNRGPQLLIRERTEEQTEAPRPRRRYTVEAIRAEADEVGVVEQFNHFVEMPKRAALAVQPATGLRENLTTGQPYTAPNAHQGGRLRIWVGPKQFAEFFPHIATEGATAALGRYKDGGCLAGSYLDRRLDQIERFLNENFRR